MGAQPAKMTSQQPIANGENVDAIHRLMTEAEQLGRSIDRWNTGMLAALAFTVIAAVGVFWTTRLIIMRSRKLASVQDQVIAAKDAQLRSELAEKDLKIAEAKAEAGRANEAAGEANKIAAQANERAAALENENLALRKEVAVLEKRTADRHVRAVDRPKLIKAFKAGAGREIVVKAVTADGNEPAVFGAELVNILRVAGWKVHDQTGGTLTDPSIKRGLTLRADSEDAPLRALREALEANAFPVAIEHAMTPTPLLVVGAKPAVE